MSDYEIHSFKTYIYVANMFGFPFYEFGLMAGEIIIFRHHAQL